MNTTKRSRGIGMKYTRYLIYGNFFHTNLKVNENNVLGMVISLFVLFRTVSLLGFSMLLFPFALTLDTGRLFYYYEIRIARKLKRYSFIYRFRRGTVNIFYRSSRLAYLLIQKTDSFIHLKS